MQARIKTTLTGSLNEVKYIFLNENFTIYLGNLILGLFFDFL